MLEVYGHGGDVESAALRYGFEPEQFTDFSANINPLGPPPGMLEALQAALPEIIRYPDPGHRALLALLAERHGVRQEAVCVGNGAAEIMALILLALAPGKVGVVQPASRNTKRCPGSSGRRCRLFTAPQSGTIAPSPGKS
ncbi:aminotransferase class I/II-fold pyridoxal phosphate-dependent enzyme [Paenibacillus woosongensis]|uniref:aminotransferase class I/II-fold pyridoxal phosphate-dependent enzyme n=1 Tax=Paenibacillus woosongensis TaxID=307580 RepID=UPI002E7BCACE|nr:aminotransferase class I/II-fold pyridoxal phosphate-dependent enzyme [Paenibacillus woosongensis]